LRKSTCHYHTAHNATPNTLTKITACSSARNAHEWNDAEPAQDSDELIVKDANGNLLADGDSVTVVKDLKVKVALPC
jgi:alkylphosphonate utilization operon protein PhnA